MFPGESFIEKMGKVAEREGGTCIDLVDLRRLAIVNYLQGLYPKGFVCTLS